MERGLTLLTLYCFDLQLWEQMPKEALGGESGRERTKLQVVATDFLTGHKGLKCGCFVLTASCRSWLLIANICLGGLLCADER